VAATSLLKFMEQCLKFSLQIVFSLFATSAFTRTGGHAVTKACDDNTGGLDSTLMTIGTAVFWFSALPILHLALKAVVPGVPLGVRDPPLTAVAAQARPSLREHQSCLERCAGCVVWGLYSFGLFELNNDGGGWGMCFPIFLVAAIKFAVLSYGAVFVVFYVILTESAAERALSGLSGDRAIQALQWAAVGAGALGLVIGLLSPLMAWHDRASARPLRFRDAIRFFPSCLLNGCGYVSRSDRKLAKRLAMSAKSPRARDLSRSGEPRLGGSPPHHRTIPYRMRMACILCGARLFLIFVVNGEASSTTSATEKHTTRSRPPAAYAGSILLGWSHLPTRTS
jgi:hypothetical protein